MKVVILAGGYGTRLSEETEFRPKPMVEIGEMPILWHIMKVYSTYGYHDFVVCAGYKQHMIKEWFADYFLHTSDITFDFTRGSNILVHDVHTEPWRVTVVDTGLKTQTGGRIMRIKEYVGNNTFMLTYGDGIGNIDVDKLLKFHKAHGKIGTVSVYNFGQNKGVLDLNRSGLVNAFREKSDLDGNLVNIGYMVFEPQIFDYLENDDDVFEQGPMERLVHDRQLMAFIHHGFWQCMDTIREKKNLERLWAEGSAPWKVWHE